MIQRLHKLGCNGASGKAAVDLRADADVFIAQEGVLCSLQHVSNVVNAKVVWV